MTLKASLAKMLIFLDRKAQITFLLTKKVIIPKKYSNFANGFSENKVLKLPEQIELNKYRIELENDK